MTKLIFQIHEDLGNLKDAALFLASRMSTSDDEQFKAKVASDVATTATSGQTRDWAYDKIGYSFTLFIDENWDIPSSIAEIQIDKLIKVVRMFLEAYIIEKPVVKSPSGSWRGDKVKAELYHKIIK